MGTLNDVAGLFLPPSPGPAQAMAYRQGTVITFNPATLENTVNVGGTVLENLPLLGVGEATLLTPGAVVGLMAIGGGGAKSFAIIGRLVRPNTADATEAIGLLNSLIFADTVATQESRTATSFGDLATVGPAVTVTVRPSGRLLVVLTSQMQFIEGASAGLAQRGGYVSVDLSGANTIDALTASDIVLGACNLAVQDPDLTSIVLQGSYTAAGVFEGLDEGVTVVTMKYASQYSGEQMDFGRRNLIVITL